jgi:selenide,water dikinase
LAPGELHNILSGLQTKNENILVGLDASDDAGVYKISDDLALVQTLDFITPVVDDPYIFGQIAAANSLSDVFAMGGSVKTAMNLAGFDRCHFDNKILKEILFGAKSKVDECGGSLIGGHTIESDELFFGLSVTGIINPNKIYKNNTIREGDDLILTKPLGSGILTTAIKADMLQKDEILQVCEVLSTLNYKASTIMQKYNVSAATDITGFGLLGHSFEMCNNTTCGIEFDFKSIPILQSSINLANMGIIPEGTYNNKFYLSEQVKFLNQYQDEIILFDAQTSGGLLIAVDEKDSNSLLHELIDCGYEYSSIIGKVTSSNDIKITIL